MGGKTKEKEKKYRVNGTANMMVSWNDVLFQDGHKTKMGGIEITRTMWTPEDSMGATGDVNH